MRRAPGAERGVSAQPVVRLDDATVVSDGTVLLDPVTARVEAGEVLAVTGANGAGKTTLLRLVAGRLRPSDGTVLVDGAPPRERDRRFRERVAALVGAPPAAHDLTLAEQLAVIAVSWGAPAGEALAAAPRALADLGIAELADRFPHELSSGQQQLFTLACVFGRPGGLLLLDEPDQRLDPDRRALVADRIVERAEAGAAVVVVSHHRDLVERAADHELHLARDPGPEDA